MTRILYDLIYVQTDYDLLMNKEFKKIHDDLVEKLVQPHQAFTGKEIMLSGVGIEYIPKKNIILSFINGKIINRNLSAHDHRYRLDVAENDNNDEVNTFFYDPRFNGAILKIEPGNAPILIDEKTLDLSISAVIHKLKEQEILEKANQLKENRTYFFDEFITPLREASRQQSIVSQFADIDFEF